MPPSLTIDAARLHDKIIAAAFHRIVGSESGSLAQRERALRQARLPVKLGGMGLTSMESIRAAAWVGTWALVWGPIRELCEEFKTVDITAVSTDNFTQLSIFTELQDAHASLLTRHAYVEGTYEEYDRKVYDFCKEGLAHFRFHPANLPERSTLLPLARFDSNSEHLQNAQRRYSLIVHHAAWLGFWNELNLAGAPRREAVRFISVSQPHAGDVLNAVPMRREFRVPTWAMRIIVQRRLGLPLDEALASGEPTCTARGGRVQDPMGDSASNIGRAGHNQRHHTVLRQLVLIMQSVWGTLVEMEPQDHLGYSNDYRPDVSGRGLGKARTRLIGDVKFKDPLSSNVEDIGRRGAFVGFGNTAPPTRADIFGLEQRGVKGTVAAGGSGNFCPSTGTGYVAYKKPDYAHALSRSDTDLLMLLFETYGGWSEPVVRLFRRMQDKVRNKLTKRQYENEVSWTTSTWLALQSQRLSVAVHIASAWEIATEMQLAGGGGEAPSSDEEGGATA